ncbi:MAG: GAF and ANTAR domain-containing protein [Nocardioidaceae bacterium]
MSTAASAGAADRYATFQQLLVDNETLHEFLAGLAVEAAADVDGALSAGVTVQRGSHQPITFGSSDTFANRLDEFQYAADDGPCLHALRTGVTVEIDDANTEVRWTAYTANGVAEGVQASLSVPLLVDGQSLGALNLYARAPRAFTDVDRANAARFADQAAGALAVALRLAERTVVAEQLKTALASRYVIDQALGVLMQRQHCDAHKAFGLLRQRSQHTNRKLRDVAAALITDTTGAPPQPAPGPD